MFLFRDCQVGGKRSGNLTIPKRTRAGQSPQRDTGPAPRLRMAICILAVWIGMVKRRLPDVSAGYIAMPGLCVALAAANGVTVVVTCDVGLETSRLKTQPD